MTAPKIDPEFRSLIPPLQASERAQLEENLAADGCREPLVLWRGILIDGHNRHEICTRRSISFRTVEIDLPSRERVLQWIDQNQLGRRNLTDDQRAAIAVRVFERQTELEKKKRAQAGRARGGDATPEQKAKRLEDTAVSKRSTKDRSRKAVSKAARVSERTLRTVQKIAKVKPGMVKAIAAGEKTVAEVKREIRAEEREALRHPAPGATLPSACALYCGDIESIAETHIEPDSVDAIITDPPYPREHLPVYAKLARVAMRVLRPGGSLLVMTGQSYLPEVFRLLEIDGLEYRWTLAYLTPGGQSTRIWKHQVNTFWKPVLWFSKIDVPQLTCWSSDVVQSATNDNDKRFHGWDQSESGIAGLIERFTLPGHVVLDPFMGGATTGVVALRMGRAFIGIDSDGDAVETARASLAA